MLGQYKHKLNSEKGQKQKFEQAYYCKKEVQQRYRETSKNQTTIFSTFTTTLC
jgi:hypothetical protein